MVNLWDKLLAEQESWVLWLPVCYAAGILLYFSLTFEPSLWLGAAALCTCILTMFLARKYLPGLLCAIALLAMSLGFFATTLRTASLAAPAIKKATFPVTVTGEVEDIIQLVHGKQVLIKNPVIEQKEATWEKAVTPAKIRLAVKTKLHQTKAGDIIRLRAVLSPPSPPVSPYGYDFAKRAYFEQIGAVGFSITDAIIVTPSAGTSLMHRIANLRHRLEVRILEVLGKREGPIVAALMIGDDDNIDKKILADMRASGLSHILSVSGMHLSLVAAIFFFFTRFTITLYEPFALRYNSKKIAAVIAVGASLFYLMISGLQVAAVRSFIMTAMVLMAVLIDRTTTPMRSIAWAALLIMIVQPESLITPSFQMSFAAVIALLASYDLYTQTPIAQGDRHFLIRHMWFYLVAVGFTSFIAGIATTPYVIYHFNQYSNYGIIANLIAMPISSFWIMPWVVLCFFLFPFGWEKFALIPMGWGIDILIWTSEWVASIPYAVRIIPHIPASSLIWISIGGLWLCLWTTRLRFCGIVLMLIGVISALAYTPPDIRIDGEGKLFAIRTENGELAFSSKRSRYIKDSWMRENGQQEEEGILSPHPAVPGLVCDHTGCIYTANHITTAFAFESNALAEDCTQAQLIIDLSLLGAPCQHPTSGHLMTAFDLRRNGATFIWLERRLRIQTVRDVRGKRPWSE